MDFRIKQLQSFLTLADTLHYGRTARALYMSQPTMTSQIKSLEESFGTRLFERDKRQVKLTDAGRGLRSYAQTIMETVDAARLHLGEVNGRQRLRISCGPWGQTALLPAVLRELAVSHPGFELEVRQLTTEQKMTQLRDGSLDALLMVGRLPVDGMRFEGMCAKPLVAMVSRRGAWGRKRSVSLRELADAPILAPQETDCSLRQPMLRALFEAHGVKAKIVAVPQSCSVQQAYVAAGAGVVIAARCAAMDRRGDVVAVPLREALPQIELGIATMEREESAAMRTFRQVVRDCADVAERKAVVRATPGYRAAVA